MSRCVYVFVHVCVCVRRRWVRLHHLCVGRCATAQRRKRAAEGLGPVLSSSSSRSERWLGRGGWGLWWDGGGVHWNDKTWSILRVATFKLWPSPRFCLIFFPSSQRHPSVGMIHVVSVIIKKSHYLICRFYWMSKKVLLYRSGFHHCTYITPLLIYMILQHIDAIHISMASFRWESCISSPSLPFIFGFTIIKKKIKKIL